MYGVDPYPSFLAVEGGGLSQPKVAQTLYLGDLDAVRGLVPCESELKLEKRQKKLTGKAKEAQEAAEAAPATHRKKSAASPATHVKPKLMLASSDKKKAADSEEEAPNTEGSELIFILI